MLEFHEVEFKYDASKVTLDAFEVAVMYLGKLQRYHQPTGWDYYFTNKKRVARFRAGELNEITVKKQLSRNNNFIRKEVNLAITPEETPKKTLAKVTEFLSLQGYDPSFAIHKTSFVYFFETFDVVYYIVEDSKRKEIGRFIEIEMDEHHPWKNAGEAYDALVNVEEGLQSIGLRPSSRLNRSLFQMFHKET